MKLLSAAVCVLLLASGYCGVDQLPAENNDNIALGKQATQSSTDNDLMADFAVDGNLKTCSKTKFTVNCKSWTVNLGDLYYIDRIVIRNASYNVIDNFKAEGFLADPEEYPETIGFLCAQYPQPADVLDLKCSLYTQGRFVRLSSFDDWPMQLCEVEIYGKKKDGEGIKLGKKRDRIDLSL